MRFLLFELLFILYFTLLNNDLRLGRLVGKQRTGALGNMRLTVTCSDQSINPKAFEVQGCCSTGGAWGRSPRSKKHILKISAKYRKNKI